MIQEKDLIKNGIIRVAELMAIAAKTAPKGKGIDHIETAVIIDRDEIEKLANKMDELSKKYGTFLVRDANNVRNSDAVVLIGARVVSFGLKAPPQYNINENIDLVLSLVNLGIAIGSAVKVASMLNVDNRIMLSIGLAAKELKLLNVDYILGIPLSAKSKNIYFDRKR